MEAEVCPKCPACREDYDLHMRLPLLLPCYHVICSACVAGQGGPVTCPTCSKVKILSESEELPRDVCTVNEVTLARLPSLPCGQCEVEGHVTHRCTMCRSLLCQDCVTQHARMKVFRKHRPLPLSSRLELRQEFFQEVELCPDGNSPSGFCWKCSSTVCSDCKDDHQGSGHDYVTLAHAQVEAHEEHGQLLQDLDSRRGELETFRKSAVAMDAKNQEVAENCGNQLLELRNQLLQAVHARVGQLQTQLRQAARVQTSRHETNMAALDQSEAEVEATKDYLTRLTQWSQPAQFLAQHRAQTSSVRQLLASPPCPSVVDLQPRQLKLHPVDLQRVLDLLTSVGDVVESIKHAEAELEEAEAKPEEAEAEPEEVFCDGSCPGVPHCCQNHASPLRESS